MKRILLPIIVLGALAAAAPASAQLVNGVNGAGPALPEAPIGTKGGGNTDSSLQIPGEAQAVAGALRNNADAKNQQALNNHQYRRQLREDNQTAIDEGR